MEIKKVQNLAEWNDKSLPFQQSWEWGQILQNEGKTVERIAVTDDNQVIIARAQLVYSPLLFGWNYVFCYKGPAFLETYRLNIETQKEAYNLLLEYIKKKNVVFFRVEPANDVTRYVLCATRKTIDINPRATLLLDLSKNEEEILDGMHAKTRYNIRLAEKKQLEIKWEKKLDIFLKLMDETGRRDKFRLHHKKHYQEILDSPLSKQITIYFNENPVASGVFIGSGEVFTYLYGASSYEFRHLMAPYLVQWEGIKNGKELGYRWYDFFGVAPRIKKESADYFYDQHHQYAGVTRFKLGFGGQSKESPGTFDIIIDRKKYWVYHILRGVRRLF